MDYIIYPSNASSSLCVNVLMCHISQYDAVDSPLLIMEVLLQEIIDMCDFSVGLSRQLNGSVIPSERKLNLDITNHSVLSIF